MGNKVTSSPAKPIVKQPTAPAAKPPPTSTPVTPSLGEKAQKRAGLINSFTTTRPAFAPGTTPPPVNSAIYARDTEEPADLSVASERRNLVGFASQLNPVSRDVGNANDICAGASVVNALILSGSPAQNAGALKAAYVSSGATAPPPLTRGDVDRAFAAFSAGKMTTTDVSVLQQVAYATLRTAQRSYDSLTAGNANDAGVNPAALATTLAQLKANGAELADSTFQLSAVDGQPHWTVRTNKTTADSMAGEFSDNARRTMICETAVTPKGRVFVDLPGKPKIVFKPSAAENSPQVIQELLRAVQHGLQPAK